MLPSVFFAGLLAIEWLRVVSAEVIIVEAQDSSIWFDQYFHLHAGTSECDTHYWSTDVGATVSFNFTGTSVSVIGSTDTTGGIYDVFVDSVFDHIVDRYGNTVKSNCGAVMFEKTNLKFTDHTLRMILRTNSSLTANFLGGIIDISEIRYTIPDTRSGIPSTRTSTDPTNPIGTPSLNSVTHDPTTSGKKNLGVIVGSVVGGMVALGLIAVLIWPFVPGKRSRNERRFSLDLDSDGAGHATPYTLPSNVVSSLPAAYFSTAPAPQYQMEPFSWESENSSIRYWEDRSSTAKSSVCHLCSPQGRVLLGNPSPGHRTSRPPFPSHS